MAALKSKLVDLIEALGPIGVDAYMAHCLFDPKFGYYMTRDPFGAAGDFTTAPEISQMFGELIGAWLVTAWRRLGRPASPIIAEIGPGRGTLARDIARTLDRLEPELRLQASFKLIEISPKLALAQATNLKGVGGTFDWLSGIGELPAQRPLLIVGNELFDAVPAKQYLMTEQGWRERRVDADRDDNLVFTAGPGTLDPSLLPPDAAGAAPGAIFEVAPAREALMQAIAERVERHGGAALFFDYGHLQPGIGDTLQAVLRHAYDDPLANPGKADLTSHVDFSALADVVRGAGLTPYLRSQGEFLLALGVLVRAGALGAEAPESVRNRLSSEVERLAGGDAMGELFKVLGFWTLPDPPPGWD